MSSTRSATVTHVETDVGALLTSIVRSFPYLIAFAALVALVAFLFFDRLTPLYRAETTILVGIGDSNPEVLRNVLAGEIQLIRSRDLARGVVGSLGLATTPEYREAITGGSTFDEILFAIGLAPDAGDASVEERVLARYDDNLDVYALDGSPVIVVAFHAADPALAARGANAVADAYLALRRSATLGVAASLEAEIERLRTTLAEAEARASALGDDIAALPPPLAAAERDRARSRPRAGARRRPACRRRCGRDSRKPRQWRCAERRRGARRRDDPTAPRRAANAQDRARRGDGGDSARQPARRRDSRTAHRNRQGDCRGATKDGRQPRRRGSKRQCPRCGYRAAAWRRGRRRGGGGRARYAGNQGRGDTRSSRCRPPPPGGDEAERGPTDRRAASLPGDDPIVAGLAAGGAVDCARLPRGLACRHRYRGHPRTRKRPRLAAGSIRAARRHRPAAGCRRPLPACRGRWRPARHGRRADACAREPTTRRRHRLAQWRTASPAGGAS